MEELNEHRIPTGGWMYYQPETKWRAPTPIASTLSQTVQLIVKMRKMNPAITAKFKLATNPEVVKTEVLRFNRKRLGLPIEGTPLPFRALPSNQSGRVGVAAVAKADAMSGLKRAAQGTGVVISWLGSGAVPVEKELAEKRAAICTGGDKWTDEHGVEQTRCRYNVPGEWFTTAPAELLKKSVEAWKTMTGKTDFKFENSQGDKLKSCNVCRCLLPLKIFTPLEHIISKTPDEVMKEFPAHCWIKNRDA